MDRRQKKTRSAVLQAFSDLLSQKHYHQITVAEIIERADIARATFYAHFETKDDLLKELCEELFCHIFDATEAGVKQHRHIFECNAPASVLLHLLQHLQNNDHHILDLLACENNELFLKYFKENLKALLKAQLPAVINQKPQGLPESFWIHHLAATFVETIKWWIENGMKESPETLSSYFTMIV